MEETPKNNEDLNFLFANIELVEEDIRKFTSANSKNEAVQEDGVLNNDKYEQKNIKAKIDRQKLDHAEDEHVLRKKHLDFLSKITTGWLFFIIAVSYLQGFKNISFFTITNADKKYIDAMPFFFETTEFSLDSSVFIALITTTTATILGLYTIAALWLYKGKKEENVKKEEVTKVEDK